MSKLQKQVSAILEKPFLSKSEAVITAEYAVNGKRTITKAEAIKLFGEAADVLDVEFTRLDKNMQALGAAQIKAIDIAKIATQRSKDYCAQVGSAMARIDKVVVKDFEKKTEQLERFVSAMKELSELEQSGALARIYGALK